MRILLLTLLACMLDLPSFAQFSFSDSAVTRRIRHDIFVLASDSLEGREAGTEGECKAYNYIIGRLQEADVRPWSGTSYLQPFIREFIKFSKPASLSIAGKQFAWRYDFGLCSCSANDSVTAGWIDCGYGLSVPGSGPDSNTGLREIEGKIVLINLETPGKFSKEPEMEAELIPAARIAAAVKRGASGVLLYNDPGKYKRVLFDFSGSDTVTIPVIYVTSEVISSIRNQPGQPVTMEAYPGRERKTYHNVVGYIDNSAPYTIILGGHYDHLGKSENPKDKGAYCVGADDNASGTAGILELARYFKTHPDPANNYMVILFSAEEEGLWGSEYFVKKANPSFMDSVNFMVNFDMIGRLGCQGLVVTAEAAGSSPCWSKLYREVKHPAFHLQKVASSLPFSDQDAFYKSGIPVLYLNTGLHSRYHTPADLPWTLNYTGMTDIIKYTEELVCKAGSGEKIPYRKVPGILLDFEMAGFILDYIGDGLSF